jgi:dihydrofolate synthase/folylpolyglutamate synthase
MQLSLFEKFFDGRPEYRHMELSLKRIDTALFAANPHINAVTNGRVIHIAGTNAKGSTAFFLANILMSEGFSVMLFTSPHIISVYERIQYNGEFISSADFDDLFSRRQNIIIENNLTYFETLFFIFMLFAEIKQPDYLVIETGLGGRFDATNTNYLHKKYPVITQIAADHREILGANIYGILSEKLAVIKENSPVFIGACKSFIMDEIRAKLAGKEIISPDERDISQALQFAPSPFNSNLTLAIRTAEYILKKNIPYKAYPLPPCRQERFEGVILDGAHNESGILALRKVFPKVGGILLSSTKEHDLKKFAELLSKCSKNIIITSIPDNPRSIEAAVAEGLPFIKDPVSALTELEGSLLQAFTPVVFCERLRGIIPSASKRRYEKDHPECEQKALFKARSEGDILVTGSLYLCAYIRKVLVLSHGQKVPPYGQIG